MISEHCSKRIGSYIDEFYKIVGSWLQGNRKFWKSKLPNSLQIEK